MTGPLAGRPPRRILVLTDRDWTHPQGGGTGTNLFGQISRWVAWGHHVTVIAGAYEGCEPVERPAPNLEIHRMGSRLTVFPKAALAVRRGVGRDADVVVEVVNGIAFFSPLWWWLEAPVVPLVHHVHQRHYVAELGLRGRVAAFALERVPLRYLYRHLQFLTISNAARDDLRALGVPGDRIHVAYLGVELPQVELGPRAQQPTLLYLGRIKAYKRIEVALDVLETVPGARLEIAGEGDHRPALEAEIERRGLGERVRLHGFVAEDRKAALYANAWLTLTASSAEGWCLTVMEAAVCGTPSAALRVGGLAESIVDGETGILAETPDELAERVRDVIDDPPRLERLGEAARARARGFTWEATAQQNLAVLDRSAEAGQRSLRTAALGSGTAKAVGLAAAALAGNAIAVLVTIAFTRLLGKDGYGSLAALLSAFTILAVAGSSLQVAVARETALGRLGHGQRVAATLRGWTRTLLIALVALCAASVVARDALAAVVGVPEEPWAAAAILPTGAIWLLLSLQRGVLQGIGAYRPVGWSIIVEAFGRLAFGCALLLAGAGVAGAFLGTPLAMALTSAALAVVLARRLGPAEPARARPRTLRSLAVGGWAPIAGLFLLAALQNVDVIVAKHEMGDDAAGAYAAAVVAAKLVVWVAIGIGLYLLPEATRRWAAGHDPRPVLVRALALLAVVAIPALAIFALVPALLLRVAFGEEFTQASDALVVLGAAMTLLAVANLAVQYMLALGQTAFLWILGVVAIAEPFLLSAGDLGLLSFATVVFGLQCVAASASLALGLRAQRRPAAASS